ncbi:MAG TPA: HAD hydrolase family protein [Trueperaceae bacterium]|nr:HAD hydrolase family protein [Trueperaceae bacterium]
MNGPGARRSMRFVLVTDLDGTLLDGAYRPGPAAAALGRLREADVPVVFCSSKTRSEQEALRAELEVSGPFVVENGSAVLVPRPCPDLASLDGLGVHVLGVSAERCRAAVGALRDRLGVRFRGFREMSAREVAEATGLEPAAAERARRREYSETLVGLSAAGAERLAQALAAQGLRLLSGGDHHTVTGAGADKGAALRWLRARLRAAVGDPRLEAVAVGDSENDVPMLAEADRAFLVARPDGRWPDAPSARRLSGVGPHGFAELVDMLLGRGAG